MAAIRHVGVSFEPSGADIQVVWRGLGPPLPQPLLLDEAWWQEVLARRAEFLAKPRAGHGDRRVADPLALASTLTSVLLAGAARAALSDAIAALGLDDHLQITVDVDPALDASLARRLWSLPWELIRLDRAYLLSDPRVSLARAATSAAAMTDHSGEGRPPEPGAWAGAGAVATERVSPLRVLVVEGPRAAPGADTLPRSGTHAAIAAALGASPNLVELLDPVVEPDLDELQAAVARASEAGPLDVVVFDGHGTAGGLYLRSEMGAQLVGAEALASALAPVRSAVLAACWGGSAVDGERSVAEALATAGTACVASTTSFEQRPSARWAASVVASLAMGRPLAAACAGARDVLGTGHHLAWHGRTSVWQPQRDAFRLRPPHQAARTGPRTAVVDARFAGDDWFAPRPELVAQIRAALVDDQVQVVELQGSPGTGKSSVLRWWWDQGAATGLPAPGAALLRDPLLSDGTDPHRTRGLCAIVASALAGRTGSHLELAADLERVGSHLVDDDDGVRSWEQVVRPSIDAAVADGQTAPLVVLVDELDQADRSFLRFLSDAIGWSPPWIRWVCTCRPDLPALAPQLRSDQRARIDLADHRDGDAIDTLAHRLLTDGGVPESAVGRLAPEIARRSDGVFLWARIVCDLLVDQGTEAFAETGVIDGLRLPAVGGALADLYRAALVDNPAVGWATIGPLVRTIGACADARGFTPAEIAALSGARSVAEVAERLRTAPLRHLLTVNDGRWRHFHQSFADWIATGAPGGPDAHAEAEAALALRLDQLRRDDRLGDLTTYAHLHLLAHLISALDRLPDHHPGRPEVEAALETLVKVDAWLVDMVMTSGAAVVARALWSATRSLDPGIIGERHEVLVQTTLRLSDIGSVASHGQQDLLRCLHAEATRWGERDLAGEAFARLGREDADHWLLIWSVGQPTRAGIAVLTRHVREITCLAWNSEGSALATADGDGTVALWDPADPAEPAAEYLADSAIAGLAWHPTQPHCLAILGASSRIGIWHTGSSDHQVSDLCHDRQVIGMKWNPRVPNQIATIAGQTVWVWDTDRPARPIHQLHHDQPVSLVKWRPGHASQLAALSLGGKIYIWDLERPNQPTHRIERQGVVFGLGWQSSELLITYEERGSIRVWPLGAPDSPVHELHTDGRGPEWHPDDPNVIATIKYGTVGIWHLALPDEPMHEFHHHEWVADICWNPAQPRYLATATGRDARIWEVPEWRDHSNAGGVRSGIATVRWHPADRNAIAAVDRAGAVRVWDLATPDRPRRRLGQGCQADAMIWHPTHHQHVATLERDGTARIWNLDEPELPTDELRFAFRLWDLDWHPVDPRQIATMEQGGTPRVWNLDEPDRPTDLPGGMFVTHLMWDPHDHERILTYERLTGTVYLWHLLEPDRPLRTLSHRMGLHCVSWHPIEPNCLATASLDGSLRVWDLASSDAVDFRQDIDFRVQHLVWDPIYSHCLHIVGTDGGIRTWNTHGLDSSATSLPQNRWVRDLRWHPADPTRVAILGVDGTVTTWQMISDGPRS